ncbi:MAG: hypothetical protein ACLUFV_02765 [Acutalibacteraceae bacterium]
MKIENRTDIFGEQIICNGNDEPLGQEAYLLYATELPLGGGNDAHTAPSSIRRMSTGRPTES